MLFVDAERLARPLHGQISVKRVLHCLVLLAVCWALMGGSRAQAGGTWTALTAGPPVGVNNCLLLSDGTVLGMNGAGQCVKLTPDLHGSYINGTWTQLAT